jgi:voltage-gated potassium channel
MSRQRAFLFGYSKRSKFLVEELEKKSFLLTVIASNKEEYIEAKEDGYKELILVDITDDDALERLNVSENDYLVSLLEDNHVNVFLTLSLHALFPKNKIIALSDSSHTTQKLKMAGATKVIDIYQVSANRIHNILHKPLATKVIEKLFSPNTTFSLREIIIDEGSSLHGKMVDEVDFFKYGIILIGMIDRELSQQFIFITSGLEHELHEHDVLVCMGYDVNLDRFETEIH